MILILAALTLVAQADTKLHLVLNWKAEPEFGGFYAAQINGAYKKHGLDVEVAEGGAGTPVVQMIAAGKAEFGIAAADEVVVSQMRGTDVVALFAVYQTNPQGIMTHPERGFKTLGDLWAGDGQIAIQTGALHTLALQMKYGKSKAKLVPYAGGITTYLNDPKMSQQCYVTSEPLLAKKQGKPSQNFLISESGFNPYATVVIARKSWIEKNHKAATEMLAAIREGWKEYLKSPDAANVVMSKINPTMDTATMKETAEIQKPFIIPAGMTEKDLGTMSLERWSTLSQQLLDLKVIKNKPDPARLFKVLE